VFFYKLLINDIVKYCPSMHAVLGCGEPEKLLNWKEWWPFLQLNVYDLDMY
jgi:hypothetical protein